jgi:hypothetical protein
MDDRMDVLPDFTTLSDDELRALIDEHVREEEEISYRRRLLHGRIDILRAELVDRIKRRHGSDESALAVDIDRLTEILAHKGPPPGLKDDAEGE